MVAVPRRHAGDPRGRAVAPVRRHRLGRGRGARALSDARDPRRIPAGRPGRRAAARRGDDPRGDRHQLRSREALHPEDEALLLAIGRQCGQAIERARLFEAERRGRERALRLRELASALAAASTPGEIADIASDRVYPLLGGRTGIVGAVSMDGEAIELVSEEGFGSEGGVDRADPALVRTTRGRGGPDGRSVVPRFARGDAVALSDVGQPEGEDQAWAGVPLRASGRTIGVLSVSYAEAQTFEDREIGELETVADQLALALERSMLQRSRDEAVRLEARVERVKAVSEAMNPKLGVSEVATAILAEAAEALGPAAGGLGTVTADGRNFEFMSTVGVVEGTAARVPVETRGPNTDAFRTGKVVRIEHAEDWRREYPKGSPLLGAHAERCSAFRSRPRAAGSGRSVFGSTGSGRSRRTSFDSSARSPRRRVRPSNARGCSRPSSGRSAGGAVAGRHGSALAGGDDRGRGAGDPPRATTGGGGGEAAAIALADDEGRSLRVIPGQMSRGTLRLRPPIDLPVTDHGALAHVYRSGRAQWVESEAAWTDRFAEDGRRSACSGPACTPCRSSRAASRSARSRSSSARPAPSPRARTRS